MTSQAYVTLRHAYAHPAEVVGVSLDVDKALDGRRGIWWEESPGMWTTAMRGECGGSQWKNPKNPTGAFRRYFYTVHEVKLT